MISTMVIAPNKKMIISAVLPKWCNSISSIWVGSNCFSSVFTTVCQPTRPEVGRASSPKACWGAAARTWSGDFLLVKFYITSVLAPRKLFHTWVHMTQCVYPDTSLEWLEAKGRSPRCHEIAAHVHHWFHFAFLYQSTILIVSTLVK